MKMEKEQQSHIGHKMEFTKATGALGNVVYFVELPRGIRAKIHKHGSYWMLNDNRSIKFRSRKKAWKYLRHEWNSAIDDLLDSEEDWTQRYSKKECQMMYPEIEWILQQWCWKMYDAVKTGDGKPND